MCRGLCHSHGCVMCTYIDWLFNHTRAASQQQPTHAIREHAAVATHCSCNTLQLQHTAVATHCSCNTLQLQHTTTQLRHIIIKTHTCCSAAVAHSRDSFGRKCAISASFFYYYNSMLQCVAACWAVLQWCAVCLPKRALCVRRCVF